MRLTQGTFSFLPDLTDEEIAKQIEYCLAKGWSIGIEYTDDPHPRNSLWEMWNLPMFDIVDPQAILHEVNACRKAFPSHYIKVNANDSTRGRETVALSFIVNRPAKESRFPDRPPGGRRANGALHAAPIRRRPPNRRALQRSEMTPTEIDVGAAAREALIDETLRALDAELIGLEPVKLRIRQTAALLLVERLRGQAGFSADPPSLHMCFTGNPGTGKTTVALRMAKILHSLGYVRRGHMVVATRDDLVGQYVGHTAPKTKEVLQKAIGGVLFIDEAYYLYRAENERDYGQEAIEILLQFMENRRDDLVVILAGYKDKMDKFFQSNPGLHSRIAHHIDFPDYTLEELMEIAELMLRQQMYAFDNGSRAAFREYLELRVRQEHFANARSVRNAIDRFRLRQAVRIVGQGGSIPKEELARIDAADVRQSRVFQGGPKGVAA